MVIEINEESCFIDVMMSRFYIKIKNIIIHFQFLFLGISIPYATSLPSSTTKNVKSVPGKPRQKAKILATSFSGLF